MTPRPRALVIRLAEEGARGSVAQDAVLDARFVVISGATRTPSDADAINTLEPLTPSTGALC